MRNLLLNLAVSLDGYIEDRNGGFDWCFTDQDYGMGEFFQRIDAVFYGRKSFELVQSMGDEAGIPALQAYVFSNTLNEAPPNTILVRGDNLVDEVGRIKALPGKDIWLFGGAGLIESLLPMGLVDELSLAVHPILLGGGTPLFPQFDNRIPLKLLSAQVYDSGLVMMRYEVTG